MSVISTDLFSLCCCFAPKPTCFISEFTLIKLKTKDEQFSYFNSLCPLLLYPQWRFGQERVTGCWHITSIPRDLEQVHSWFSLLISSFVGKLQRKHVYVQWVCIQQHFFNSFSLIMFTLWEPRHNLRIFPFKTRPRYNLVSSVMTDFV